MRTKLKCIILCIAWGLFFIIACYDGHGLSPPGDVSGIEGRITFIGDWPDSTKEVRLAVLKKYPLGMNDKDSLLVFVISNLAALGDPIPMGVDHFDYQLPLEAADFDWVLVVWLPDDIFGIKELGAYYANPDQSIPTPISVPEGVMLEGIDIVADFANVHRDKPFFKRGALP